MALMTKSEKNEQEKINIEKAEGGNIKVEKTEVEKIRFLINVNLLHHLKAINHMNHYRSRKPIGLGQSLD